MSLKNWHKNNSLIHPFFGGKINIQISVVCATLWKYQSNIIIIIVTAFMYGLAITSNT